MKNEAKTKEQLILELAAMRQRVAEMEKIEGERKRTDEALRESEKRYKEVVESAADIIHTTDIQGNFLFANTATLKAAATSLEEFKKINYLDIIHPDHRQRLAEVYINQFRERKETIYVEFPILSRSGEVIWLGQNSSLMMEGKKVVGFHSVARDITELKKAEEKLRRSEEEAKRLAQENAVMAEIGRIMSSNPNIEEIYERFIEEVRKLIQGDRITIAIGDPNGSILTLAYAWGLEVEGRKTGGVYPLAGTASGKAMQIRSSILTQGENIEEVLRLFPAFSSYYRSGFQSMIVVPLISKNNVIGTLLFLSTKPKAYTQIDVLLAERVGNEIAGAIDNARLFAEHKKAGIIIREQLDFLQVLIDTIPSPIFFKDREGRFLGGNKAWEQMNGLKQEQMVGKTVFEIAPPDLAAIYRAQDEELFLSGGVQRYEATVASVEGKKHDVIFNKATFTKADGTVGGLVGVVLDITERKRAQEELRELAERYRSILDNIEEGYFEVDPAGNFTFFNDALCRELGYSQEEMMGMNNRQYMDKETAKKVYQAFNRVYTTGESYKAYDWELTRKDGTKIIHESSVYLMRNTQGERVGFRGITRNITERRRAEEELRKSEGEARRLAEENRVVSDIGRIISSTLNVEEVYGRFSEEVRKLIPFDRIVINLVSPDQKMIISAYMSGKGVEDRRRGEVYPLAGTTIGEMIHTRSSVLFQTEEEEEVKRRFPGILSTFKAGFRSMLSVPLISKNEVIGGLLLRTVRPNAYTDRDVKVAERVGNQISGAIANAQLFSERERAEKERMGLEEQLRQAQKMEAIGTLAGGIAHDFNNILVGILGYIELANLDIPAGSEIKYNLQQAIKSTYRARDLVKQILAFSRQSKEERKPLDVRPIVKEVLKMLRASLPATIEIRQNIEVDRGAIEADPTQIHQVLMNLCTNAAHAMSENGGVLEVSLTKFDMNANTSSYPEMGPGPYLKLQVRDTGHGITPEILSRIFDPYFTTKETGKGTGLGLAVVHGIVKSHKGAIAVSSEPGKGTTFDIYLPRIDAAKAPSEAERIEPLPLGGRERVLFVDDEKAIVEIGQKLLQRLGYEVVGRTSSVEALELFRAKPESFDLIVTDMTMPNMTGDKLAQELMVIRPDIPVILCTGFSERMTEEKARALGIREFALKPLVMQDLAKSMRRALEQKKKKKG